MCQAICHGHASKQLAYLVPVLRKLLVILPLVIIKLIFYKMCNSNSDVETSSIDKINDIDVEQLGLSNIDKLHLKAIKQKCERLKNLKKKNLTN